MSGGRGVGGLWWWWWVVVVTGETAVTHAFLFPNTNQLFPLLVADDSGGGGGDGGCVDMDARCRTWSQRGECGANPTYMLVHCPRACHLCTPPPSHLMYTDVLRSQGQGDGGEGYTTAVVHGIRDEQENNDPPTTTRAEGDLVVVYLDDTSNSDHLVLVPWQRAKYDYAMKKPSQVEANTRRVDNRPFAYPTVMADDTQVHKPGCYMIRGHTATNRRQWDPQPLKTSTQAQAYYTDQGVDDGGGGGGGGRDDRYFVSEAGQGASQTATSNSQQWNPQPRLPRPPESRPPAPPPPQSPLSPPPARAYYSGEGVHDGADDGYYNVRGVGREPSQRRVKRMVNTGVGKGMSRDRSPQNDRRRGQRCDNVNLRKFTGTRQWREGEGKRSPGSEGRHEGAEGKRRTQVVVQRGEKRRQNRWNSEEGGSRKRVMMYKPQQQQIRVYGGGGGEARVKNGSRRRLILYRPQHQQQQQYGGDGGTLGELVSKKVDKITKLMSVFSGRQQSLHAVP